VSQPLAAAITLLCREIGAVNTARFINHFSSGFGNYTDERDNLPGNPTVDDLVKEIEVRRRSSRPPKKRKKSAARRQPGR